MIGDMVDLNLPGQIFAYGFSYRKRNILRALLPSIQVTFVSVVASTPPDAVIIIWGAKEVSGCLLEQRQVIRVEDGFFRSIGLGSDFIYPNSLVFDRSGIYFDARSPSGLENILNEGAFSQEDLVRAEQIRQLITKNRLTKYNTELSIAYSLDLDDKKLILVPGQVEDDASILFGGGSIKTNLGLLKAVRAENPEAYIIYKPHPDVQALNRKGRLAEKLALQYANLIEHKRSVIDCIDVADEIHTMTSLVGFDALLRDKKVVTYGEPFYAGWGLTQDRYLDGDALKRRTRQLTTGQLVAGALIHYAIYWDWRLKKFISCEAALCRLAADRDALVASGQLEKLRVGFIRRQLRKLSRLAYSFG